MKEEVVKSEHEMEHGTDYSDDVWSEEAQETVHKEVKETRVETNTPRQRRMTFYQSHIFPMHLLHQLKVLY